MIKLKSSERNLLYAVIAVAAAALLYSALTGKSLKGAYDLKREIIAKKSELRRLNYLLENSETIKRQWGGISDASMEAVAGRYENAPVLDNLYRVANISGIKRLTSITPMQARFYDTYAELPVQITLQAAQDTLMRFLFNLENSALPFAVEYLSVYPDTDEPEVVFCQATVTALRIGAKRPQGENKERSAAIPSRIFGSVFPASHNETPAGRENLEMTLRDLEDSLVVSGFVFDGVLTKALIENRRRGTGAEFYKEEDVIEGAKITRISEKDGEVVLIYPGGGKLTLKMNKTSGTSAGDE